MVIIPKPTGFEDKPTRVVMENWLYHEDRDVRVSALTEMRKRFEQRFPKPEWAKNMVLK